jgi:CHRD domain
MTLRTSMALSAMTITLALSACAMQPMMARHHAVSARLTAASEVPPVASSASGSLDGTLNPHSGVLTWTLTYADLSGPATGAHFHGPAMAGQNAGVVIPFTGSLSSPIRGSATLNETQQADVKAGRWYVNVHTAANPGGEIRGQLASMQP